MVMTPCTCVWLYFPLWRSVGTAGHSPLESLPLVNFEKLNMTSLTEENMGLFHC